MEHVIIFRITIFNFIQNYISDPEGSKKCIGFTMCVLLLFCFLFLSPRLWIEDFLGSLIPRKISDKKLDVFNALVVFGAKV